MRGPSARAWSDTNMQYTAPMIVMTLKSDERNIWKTKPTSSYALQLFQVAQKYCVGLAVSSQSVLLESLFVDVYICVVLVLV